jgi:Amt family ammonium transporter
VGVLHRGDVRLLLKILDATMGLRVEESEEDEGLDVSQHGESAYELE